MSSVDRQPAPDASMAVGRTPASIVGAVLLIVLTGLVAVAFVAGLFAGYAATATPVSVTVDEMTAVAHTHEATVAELLDELGLDLLPSDRLSPAPETSVTPGLVVTVARSRPVVYDGGGALRTIRTHETTVGGILGQAGIDVGLRDVLRLDGAVATLDTVLPAAVPGRGRWPGVGPARPWRQDRPQPVQLELHRAVPLTVIDGEALSTIWTTASTVGEALAVEGWAFFEGDLVEPPLGTPIAGPLDVAVTRSLPVTIESIAGVHHTRSRQETVADLLAEQRIILAGLDRVEPPLDTPLADHAGMTVHVTRVEHVFEIEEEVTPYNSVWQPDPEMEIDTRGLDQEGANGIMRWRYRTILENGQPITTTLDETWLAQQPVTRVLSYGTKIVLREVETTQGPETYWRKIRMFATSYAPDEAGVPVDSPYYGLSRMGTRVRRGIVAVDPRVVRLGSTVYVPGYGVASAQDTGGLIDGRWIDLAYDSAAVMERWGRCVDVYVLGEPPPSYQINYLLPNYPTVACLRR